MVRQSDDGSGQLSPVERGAATQAGGPRPRLRWRAVIHPGDKLDPARGVQAVAWHLADCHDPSRSDAHCDVGRHLLATDGNPDGHCRVAGVCPRCPDTARSEDQL
jgi:hypothetical protein